MPILWQTNTIKHIGNSGSIFKCWQPGYVFLSIESKELYGSVVAAFNTKKTMLDIVPKGLNYEEALASGKIGEIQKDAALSFSPTVTVRPVIRIAIK